MENTETSVLWNDIVGVFFSDATLEYKYRYFYKTLNRLCIAIVEPLKTDYNDLFSRLQAVCRLTCYPLSRIDGFRWRAKRISDGSETPDEATYLVDTKAFMEAVAHFTESKVPSEIMCKLPDSIVLPPLHISRQNRTARCRFIAVKKDEVYIYAVSPDVSSDDEIRINYKLNAHTIAAAELLTEGTAFNAVDFTVDYDGVYHPVIIVVNPDYLIDISSLTASVRPYGDSPLNYLLRKFEAPQTTKYILLGQLANQFLDDCVNNENADYSQSMRRAFMDYAVDFTACPDIDEDFFKQSRQHFENIKKVVSGFFTDETFAGDKRDILLEPSFFCETLGLQGRMDFLQSDCMNLIELKSGKMDEFNNRPVEEHLLQMILYKEVLHYNLGVKRNDVRGFLLYSKYPKLIEQRSVAEMVSKMMTLRNEIVAQELKIASGEIKPIIEEITPEDLITKNVSQKFWQQWCLPSIMALLSPLQAMDELTKDYFYTFLRFVAQEHLHAKIGDTDRDSTSGMANLWIADAETKMENGDLISGLSVTDIRYVKNGDVDTASEAVNATVEAVTFKMPDLELMQPNFREGDAVVLYQKDESSDTAVTRQIIRCGVEKCSSGTIVLKLRFRQRNDRVFRNGSLFAIEHDHIESSFRSLYSGLHSLVCSPSHRRDLLLCQSQPRRDESIKLAKKHLNAQVDDIVLRAKQAKDYFLLVGPPGTGKTSVALKSMVEEFVAEGESLLLLAYTNRAVDEICNMLEGLCKSSASSENELHSISYLRFGNELACAPHLRHRLVSNAVGNCKNRTQIATLINSVPIIVGTLSSLTSAVSLFRLRRFDTAIIDEVSQILEPQILPLLTEHYSDGTCAIGKFVMIGDHKQLPAVVVQPKRKSIVHSQLLNGIGLTDCSNSLFERLCNYCKSLPQYVGMLDHQGRMHPQIGVYAAMQFYEGQLVPVPTSHQKESLPYKKYSEEEMIVATRRLAFIDVPLPKAGEWIPKSNIKEAELIVNVVRMLMNVSEKNGVDFVPSEHLGIIVPFRRQITTVRRLLHECGVPKYESIMIDTVERYQGSQRDIILYGTTIAQPYELSMLSSPVEVGGTLVDRKLNVAVTRARKQLFVFGNRNLLMQNPLYASLIDYCGSAYA